MITYPAPYTRMREESTTRRPQDLRHESVVQVEKSGSENALDGANGVKALGLDWKYLQVRLEQHMSLMNIFFRRWDRSVTHGVSV